MKSSYLSKILLLTLTLVLCLCSRVRAQNLNDFQYKSRLVLIFTPSPDDPNFQRQYQTLRNAHDELDERRLVILSFTPEGKFENTGVFADESLSRWYYEYFDVDPYQMEIILVGLDGNEKFRARNTVVPPVVIWETIDAMPMRRQELLQGYGNKSQLTRENDDKPSAQRYH